jgi:IS5 family transposase
MVLRHEGIFWRAVVATAANVHDSAVLGDLLHGEEADV